MTKIVILTGPTGVGKTEVAIEIAKSLPTEIISADSRQVYKQLTIGTNKPIGKWKILNKEKVYIYKDVPYHLVDFLEPTQNYDAGSFYNDATKLIKKIIAKNKIPLVVGGTGLYTKTLTYGISNLPKRDETIRKYLLSLKELYGNHYLYNMLKTFDSKRASEIHPNNIQRIVRSLEIILQTGKPFSTLIKEMPKTESFEALMICININKNILKERIIQRTEWMLKNGIIEETKQLLSNYGDENIPAFSSIGYKWVIKFIKNELDIHTVRENIIKDTMAYIKRQIVWFKKDKELQWLDCTKLSLKEISNKLYQIIQNYLWKK